MESRCPESKFSLPTDFFTYEHLLRVVRKLDFTSSPGIPYLYDAPTLKELFGWDGVSVNEDVVWRFWEQIKLWERGELEPNPIRLFIKEEPHKIEKIQEGRLRLISSVAILEQLIDHMLMDAQDNQEIQNWSTSPFKPGMRFVRGGLNHFTGKKNVLAADKSSWDWTVSEALKVDLEFRRRMCLDRYNGSGLYPKWSEYLGRRFDELYGKAVFQLSNGMRLKQDSYGLVKSGSVNTISTNSHLQLLYHLIAWRRTYGSEPAPDANCLGDDTAVEWPDDRDPKAYLEETKRLGCKIRFARVEKDQYSFAGHVINSERAVPEYSDKHAFQIPYYGDDSLEVSLDSLQRLYALDGKRLPIIHKWLANLAPHKIFSPRALEIWYRGLEPAQWVPDLT
jgi:hypothetical protein